MHGFQIGKGFTFLEKQRGEAGPSPARGKGLELDTRYPSAAGCHGGLEAHWGDGTGFGCVKLTVETEFQSRQKESRAVRKLLQWFTREDVGVGQDDSKDRAHRPHPPS